jgi:hypothetical protein
MKPPRILKEVLLAVALLAFGMIGLPPLIFLVGQQVVGAYEDGIVGLYQAIGNALVAGNAFAWILILSPYLSVLLVRFGFWVRRQRRTAN